jgi:hypothetical protein
MGSAGDLADQFIATHKEFYDLVKHATPVQWRAEGVNHPEIRRGDEDEGRPVGLIAHHVGNAYQNSLSRCRGWIRGEDSPPPTDETNKRHAAENPDPDHRETLRFLNEKSAELEAFIRGLSDRELAAIGTFVRGPTTVEEFIGRTVPFHIRWHLGSIQATWDQLAERPTSG